MPTSAGRVEGTLAWWALIALLGAAVGYALHAMRDEGRHMHAQEQQALSAAEDLMARLHEHQRATGRYAGLEELAQAGRLAAAPGTRDGRASLGVPGYTLHVLLPTGTNAAGEVLLEQAPATSDPLLVARHVAVVARPLRPGEDGYRAWYLDETGRVFLQEGVSDLDALRETPFPRVRLPALDSKAGSGSAWHALESIPEPR